MANLILEFSSSHAYYDSLVKSLASRFFVAILCSNFQRHGCTCNLWCCPPPMSRFLLSAVVVAAGVLVAVVVVIPPGRPGEMASCGLIPLDYVGCLGLRVGFYRGVLEGRFKSIQGRGCFTCASIDRRCPLMWGAGFGPMNNGSRR